MKQYISPTLDVTRLLSSDLLSVSGESTVPPRPTPTPTPKPEPDLPDAGGSEQLGPDETPIL